MIKNSQLVIVCRDVSIDWKQFSNPIYVGVESGTIALIKNKLPINFVCGDFDSVSNQEWQLINQAQEQDNFKIFKVNQEKDYLDSELAITTALELKLPFQQIVIISNGNRWDMILAQINFLRKYHQYQPILIDQNNYLFTLPAKSKFVFPKHLLQYHYLSFFCFDSQKVIYNFTGCKYGSGTDIIINNQDVLAISNEFDLKAKQQPTIIIKTGNCIVVLAKK